jgi:UDP-GlcNAc:undecaprenyl-phosphate GlcNAc-1-phosphate transferase
VSALEAAAFVVAAMWHVAMARLAPRLGLVKPNFRKTPVMSSYGLVAFPYIAAAAVILASHECVSWNRTVLYLWVMAATWALGAIDDIWGSREVSGFAGHFSKLIFERKLTTGALKAIGGGIVSLVAAYLICRASPVPSIPYSLFPIPFPLRVLIAAATIALATNLLNLFDLRPGRAVAVLFAGLGVTYIVARGRLVEWPLVAATASISLLFGIADSRGRAMMGDSGSNSLGAALGLTIVLSAPSWMLPAIVVMAAVHIYSEKRSISGLIEGNRVLRAVDRCLGVR